MVHPCRVGGEEDVGGRAALDLARERRGAGVGGHDTIVSFGRTVADQVLEAVDGRMRAKPAPGVEAHVAGRRTGSGPAFAAGPQGDPMSGEADASGPGQPTSGRGLLPGTSFALTAATGDRSLVSVWGQGAATRFAGRDAAGAEAGGDVAVDGEVAR